MGALDAFLYSTPSPFDAAQQQFAAQYQQLLPAQHSHTFTTTGTNATVSFNGLFTTPNTVTLPVRDRGLAAPEEFTWLRNRIREIEWRP